MIQTHKGSRRKSTLKSGLVLATSLRAQRWRWRRQKTQLHEGWTDHREAPLKGRRCLWIRKPENLPRLSTTATNKKKIKLMLRAWFENDQQKKKHLVNIGMRQKCSWVTFRHELLTPLYQNAYSLYIGADKNIFYKESRVPLVVLRMPKHQAVLR